jgi:hypothetical protein
LPGACRDERCERDDHGRPRSGSAAKVR